MTRLLREPARNRHRFAYRQVSPQFIFSRPRHLPRCQEVRLVEIFQGHRDLRLVQKAAVCLSNRPLHLWHREPFRQQCPRPSQRHEAIRLHRQALVEVRRECEIDVHRIRFPKPIKRMAFPSECRISRATRFPGLCDRSAAGAARPCPVLVLRALRRPALAGGWSRGPRFRSRRRYRLLSRNNHGELQDEHARNSKNYALCPDIHLPTLAVAPNGELTSPIFFELMANKVPSPSRHNKTWKVHST